MSQTTRNDLLAWARGARPGTRIRYAEGADAAATEAEAFRMVEALTSLDLVGPSLARRSGRLVYLATRTATPCPPVDLIRSAFDRAVADAAARVAA